MYCVLLCEDVENTLQHRQGAAPAHLTRLQALADQGRLLSAGAHPAVDTEEPRQADFPGSLDIAEFDTWTSATA